MSNVAGTPLLEYLDSGAVRWPPNIDSIREFMRGNCSLAISFPMMTMILQSRMRRAVVGVAAFALCMTFFLCGFSQAAQRKKGKSIKLAPAGAPSVSPAPLRQGEKLDYTAHISKVSNVATIQLAVIERRDFFGKSAWHLQAVAHTVNPLRMVFELDDQFDSYSDAATLMGLQYEMHLNERGQRQDFVFRLTSEEDPAPPNATAVRVLAGTRDPLGFVDYLRTLDWQQTKDVSGPVYDGRNLYEVRAHLASDSSVITVPAGSYTASRIEVRVFQHGTEMKDTHFWVSLAHDSARTPVLLEAEIPLGIARVELTHAE